jgi:eukaryotic-like serine/threonine-protein kinase
MTDVSEETPSETGHKISEKPGDKIGRYYLLEKIGEGGFGDVWVAEQEEPVRRRVALKIVKLGMDTRSVVARFEAEQQALALMDHPSIARVFDGGATDSGRPYFVMELVRGQSITQYSDESKIPTRDRLELFVQVCRAVQHAHQKGVIHRDLKPSNVLVTEQDGWPLPKVIDFGVAKAIEGRLTDKTLVTGFQQMIGTPTYMSPVQAGLGNQDIDARSDIYSLGVLLYELLTGSTPFDTKELLKAGYDHLLRTIRDVDPPKPSTRLTHPSSQRSTCNSQPLKEQIVSLRGELDWIVMKCLEKDRSRRYETASGLAMDIERYLHDEPVLARPPSALYRWRKFTRKHRGAVIAAAGFVVLLSAATGISLGLAKWANRERIHAVKAHAESRANEKRTLNRLWDAYLAHARANRWSRRPGQRFDGLDALAKAAAILPSLELRNEAIACMTLPDLRFGRKIHAFIPNGGVGLDAAFERYAVSDEQGNITVRRIADDVELGRLPGPGVWGNWPEFSPDGRFLAASYRASWHDFPNAVNVWNLSTREIVLTVSNCWGCQTFSPDNRYILLHPRDNGLLLYDAKTLQKVRRLEHGDSAGFYTRFSRDGKLLAIPSRADSNVRIVEVATGRLLRTLSHPGVVRSVGWHPNGRWLAAPCADGKTYLWDVIAGRQIDQFGNHNSPSSWARFSPRGNLLLTSSWDSTFSLWDLAGRVRLLVMSAYKPLPHFNPDETLAGLVAIGNQFALLEGNTAPECRPLRLLLGKVQPAIQCARISADGRLLAAGSADGLRIWDLKTDQALAYVAAERVESLAFLPNDSGLVTCGDAGLFLWPLGPNGTSRERLRLGPPQSLAPGRLWRGLTLDASRRRLAASQYPEPDASNPSKNFLLDLGSTNPPTVITPPSNQGAAALSPDGRWLAAGAWRAKEVTIWNATNGAKICELPVNDSAYFPRFSPDGRWLVAGTASKFYCWEVGTWRTVYRIVPDETPTGQPSTATFRPDSQLIAVYHRNHRTHLIDARRGRVLATLDLDRHESLCFSPDGGSLVMAAPDGQLKILDLRRIRQQLAEMNLDWDLPPLPPPRPSDGLKRLFLTVVTNQLTNTGGR